MRRQTALFVLLLAFSLGPRVEAQVATPAPIKPEVRPEAVIARLMSFDRNHDGLVERAELPERMQPLLSRGDGGRDDALAPAELAQLVDAARRQETLEAPKGLQPGVYGFSDEDGPSTESHLNGAIEDLRLASEPRDAALSLARTFAAKIDARASTRLTALMAPLLNESQLRVLKAAMSRPKRFAATTLLASPGPLGTISFTERTQAGEVVGRTMHLALPVVIRSFNLEPAQHETALAALKRFNTDSQLTAADRSVLLQQLQPVLTDEQRDDLRAALERRPVVKQGTAKAALFRSMTLPPVRTGLSALRTPPPAAQTFGMTSLVLKQ